MKKLVFLFALTTLALGALYVIQGRKLADRQAQVSTLSGDLEQKSQQIESLERTKKLSEQQRRDLLRQAADLAAQVQARQVAETKLAAQAAETKATQPAEAKAATQPADTKAARSGPASLAETAQPDQPGNDKGGFGRLLSKMIQDPDTKKVIHDQQRQCMGQLYDPLIQQMGLTPEEAAKFKELMTDNVMKWTEKASPLYAGSSSGNSAALSSGIAADQENFDKELKAFLGDARFAQYKDYYQTVTERAQLNQFRQQTSGRYGALTDQQAEQLLALMKQEKENLVAADQSGPGTGQNQAGVEPMLSGDQFDQLLKTQESLGQRVYDRARTVLSPAQLDDFGRFQSNQLQIMRWGIGTARQLLSSDQTTGAAAPAGQ
jgi:hypothetical protein